MTDWTYGTVRIFTQSLEDTGDQILARLEPLGGGTTIHKFGYGDLISKVSGYIVGLTDRATLITMYRSGNDYTLTTPWASWGDYYLKNLSLKPINSICQTIRPDLADDAPVFEFSFELYKNE
jgi:hypothetical protein